MIIGVNMLFEDMIIALSFRNMFLSISKIGHKGPSTVLEDVENWLEFMIGTHFLDLEAGPAVQNLSTDSTSLAIVGAVQLATHMAVQYLIFLDIVVRKGIPLMYMMSI